MTKPEKPPNIFLNNLNSEGKRISLDTVAVGRDRKVQITVIGRRELSTNLTLGESIRLRDWLSDYIEWNAFPTPEEEPGR